MTDTELKRFLDEYSDHEREIQRYIGVYLSGVVLIIGWIIGNSTPSGPDLWTRLTLNSGLNAFLALIVAFMNAVLIVFLIFKHFSIQEVMQFTIKYSDAESALVAWERWRRSPKSITAKIRGGYYSLIITIPGLVGVSIVYIIARTICSGDFASLAHAQFLRTVLAAVDALLGLFYTMVAVVYFRVQKRTVEQWHEILNEKAVK